MDPRPKTLIAAAAAVFAACGTLSGSDAPPQSSSEIAALIKAGLPVFKANPADLSVPEGAVGPRPAASAQIPPPAGVVRTNPYVMLEQKPLTEESARSDIGIADYAMEHNIGGIDELDRGFLNAYTLPELWAKSPILGALPFAGAPGTVTNQERATAALQAGAEGGNPEGAAGF